MKIVNSHEIDIYSKERIPYIVNDDGTPIYEIVNSHEVDIYSKKRVPYIRNVNNVDYSSLPIKFIIGFIITNVLLIIGITMIVPLFIMLT